MSLCGRTVTSFDAGSLSSSGKSSRQLVSCPLHKQWKTTLGLCPWNETGWYCLLHFRNDDAKFDWILRSAEVDPARFSELKLRAR